MQNCDKVATDEFWTNVHSPTANHYACDRYISNSELKKPKKNSPFLPFAKPTLVQYEQYTIDTRKVIIAFAS
jgi:hypothetical protein